MKKKLRFCQIQKKKKQACFVQPNPPGQAFLLLLLLVLLFFSVRVDKLHQPSSITDEITFDRSSHKLFFVKKKKKTNKRKSRSKGVLLIY